MPDVPWKIQLVRSPRRARTFSARLVGDALEVRVPEGLAPDREREIVDKLVARLEARVARAKRLGDVDLTKRAEELNRRYFDGKLQINSVRYVANQRSRFGSCTTGTGAIRLSDRLAQMPVWVQDYVLVHELAHLVEPNHSSKFWDLVHRYKLAERAIGYLMAIGMDEGLEAPRSGTSAVDALASR